MSFPILTGVIEHGRGKGHQAGFPTANLKAEQERLPEYGVWASALIPEGDAPLEGVTNVGTRPTADDSPAATVETWLPGYAGDLYGRRATLILLERLRGIRTFESMAALKQQIDQDAARASQVSGDFLARSVTTRSPMETRAFGARLAGLLRRGDVITLRGDLGAGKSELARGIARGLGVEGVLPSPTFTILNAYEEASIPLYHYDWYRIEDPEELTAIGAEEHLPGDGVTLVEWAEQAPELLPAARLEISLIPAGPNQRLISWTPMGGFRPINRMELMEAC